MSKILPAVKKICIVTTRHISYNPRVLKEADAFSDKGYCVSVVTINNHYYQHQFDNEIMKTRLWKLRTVNFRKNVKAERLKWIYLSFKQKFYSFLTRFSWRFGFAERSVCRGFDELLKLALKENADFYLVHHPEALGIGYKAARTKNAKLGFDAEDFHTGMDESGFNKKNDQIISFIEKKYLPYCSYITAASKGINEAYGNTYGIKQGAVILNVFPKENLNLPIVHQPLRFYWYSQAIGPNRSLEIVMHAAAQIKEPFEIHLRGNFHSGAYKKLMYDLAHDLNLTEKVFFHEPILAGDIISDAAKFDVGLALESDVSVNRNICVTNKIFSYLMSGLAIIGTDTYGQKDIFTHFKEAVILCGMNDAADLAKAMLFFIRNNELLLKAKEAARKAADERFNWEYESEIFIDNFENTLGLKKDQTPIYK